MSKIQQLNDTAHIRYQNLPTWVAVGDLLRWDGTNGWKFRTSVNDPINAYVASIDTTGTWGSLTIGNGITAWMGWYAVGVIVYEDTANPTKTTNSSWGKRIWVIKWGAGWLSGSYEWDSLFIDCFWNNASNWLSKSSDWDNVFWQDNNEPWNPAMLKSNREVPMWESNWATQINFGNKKVDWTIQTNEAIEMSDANVRKRFRAVNPLDKKWFEAVMYTHADWDGYWSDYWYQFWSYPIKSDGTFGWFHADIQSIWTETSPDVFEHIMRILSSSGKYYLWWPWYNYPLWLQSNGYQSLMIRPSDGLLGTKYLAEYNIPSCIPSSFTNAVYDQTYGWYDYYKVESSISIVNPPYPAPAWYFWKIKGRYNEFWASASVANVACIHNNIWNDANGIANEFGSWVVPVWWSITEFTAPFDLLANNTWNVLRFVRYLRLPQWSTLWNAGWYSQAQYNSWSAYYQLCENL